MPAFKFKQFEIKHDKSTLKVGTDAVLLGAWIPISNTCENILDIGSGCGIITLMLAQRSNAIITGVDIDKDSTKEATENADNSPWKDRINFQNISIQNFCISQYKNSYDLIVSNPPFFVNSLKSPTHKRNISRHTDTLSFEDLISTASYCLSPGGLFALIVPSIAKEIIQEKAKNQGLFCIKVLLIQPFEHKPANRVIMLFSREEQSLQTENLIIRNASMEYASAYRSLTKDFYLDF